jgi:hypothetical protein
MLTTKTCYQCQKTGILDTATVCSQCGTLLALSTAPPINNIKAMENIREISILKGQNVEYKGKIEHLNQTIFGLKAKIIGYCLLFCTASIIGIYYANKRINYYQNIIKTQEVNISTLQKEEKAAQKVMATYRKMFKFHPINVYYGKAVLPERPLINEVMYVVEMGDDLETVSTFFFGNTNFAHNIGRDNGLSDHDKIQPEQKLRVRAHY